MLHGCDGLNEAAPLQVLIEDANYLPNASFSQQLETLHQNYNGHAVSIQTSSGDIIGCGRFEPRFNVEASYRGRSILTQIIPFFPAVVVSLSQSDILQYNILDGIASTCSSRASIFDPWSPPGTSIGTLKTSDQFPVGDLPNHRLELISLLPEVPLIGRDSVLGHAVSHDVILQASILISLYHLYTLSLIIIRLSAIHTKITRL